jgi:hypothetical protein
MVSYASVRLTRFETAPATLAEIFGGGYLLAFEASSTYVFDQAVTAVKTLPRHHRRWMQPFGAWWISADGAEALASTIPAIAEALNPGTFRKRTRKRKTASSTDTAAPSTLPAPVLEAFTQLYLVPSAPPFVVQAVWRALCRQHHPDIGGDTAAMARINGAYELARPWAEQQQQARSA